MNSRTGILLFIFMLLILGNIPYTQNESIVSGQLVEGVPEFCTTLSDPSNVCIVEGVQYEAPVGNERPKAVFWGYLYWEFIAGQSLFFFFNTSNLLKEPRIYDPDFPNSPNAVEWVTSSRGDFIQVTPSGKHFAYIIESYYEPDVVEDTGFIVVFQSQVVNFPLPRADDEFAWYKVDYSNTIILPKGAGIVSYAPTDDSNGPVNFERVEEGRYMLHWEYRNRAMDSKHDPLITQVTYSYDRIYLQFTDIIYRNLIQQQRQQDEQDRLNLLNSAFRIISALAIVASLISVLVAYLLVRKRFDPLKQKARELPRRQAIDVEKEQDMKIEVRRMLMAGFIVFLVITPNLFASTHAQTPSENIKWFGQYEIFEDNTLIETVRLDLPIPQSVMKVWVNTSSVWNVEFRDENGVPLSNVKEFPDRFEISNPPLIVEYTMTYRFKPYDNNGMLVYIDRFWLEYPNPNAQSDESRFLLADIDYNVVLPEKAIIYSASPSEKVQLLRDQDGRKRVKFTDTNREIDAFHDAWETQVTYSFIDVLEAIEKLDTQFYQFRTKNRNINEIIRQNQDQILIFAVLGLIAPLISFIIAYWTFRRRALKEIERLQQQQEEQILVETDQINAFLAAKSIDPNEQARDALLGYYWELVYRLKTITKKDPTKVGFAALEREANRSLKDVDLAELMNLLDEGQLVESTEEPVSYEQFAEYAERALVILDQL